MSDKKDPFAGLPKEMADIMWGGKLQQSEYFVPSENRPLGFVYPESYERYTQHHPVDIKGLGPWGYTVNLAESSARHSQRFSRPLVVFAQAFDEDMLACFEGVAGSEPRVIVLNPWGDPPAVVAELDNFDAWLVWAKQNAAELGY